MSTKTATTPVGKKQQAKAARSKPGKDAADPARAVAHKAESKDGAAMMPLAEAKPPKAKAKLVRDSFTMPQADFDLIAGLKERALGFKRPAKKSELLRAGLQAISGLNDTALKAALDALTPLKPGRPKKAD